MLHDNYFDQLGYQQLFEAFGLSPTTGRVTLPTLLIAPRHALSLQLLCPWVYEKALSSAALQAVVGRLRFLHFGCFCNQAANLMRFPTCYLFASSSFHGFLSSAFFRFLPFFLPCLFFLFLFPGFCICLLLCLCVLLVRVLLLFVSLSLSLALSHSVFVSRSPALALFLSPLFVQPEGLAVRSTRGRGSFSRATSLM